MTGDQVKRLRKRLKMTQQALADTLGVTQTSVARWEMGLHEISAPTARLLKMLVKAQGPARKAKRKKENKVSRGIFRGTTDRDKLRPSVQENQSSN